MDNHNFKLAQELVNPSYIRLAQNSINKREKIFKILLSQRQLLDDPLDDLTIQYFIDTLALMDSNNFEGKIGVGQRQSRIFSRIVQERHFHMGHGIGRSGDVMANQPKAAGSSLLLQLSRYLMISALHELNYQFVKDVLLLPLATGMSLSLAFLVLSEIKPDKKYVLWSRIDQKTCLKSILTANLIPIVVQLKQQDDYLSTDLQSFQKIILQIGPDKILSLVSTTSCFAPRVPDNVSALSVLAKKYGIFHVVNNAYGIWCTKIANSIKQGIKNGQCTIVVQSTDKNFMVPVGGSVLFSQDQKLLQKISSKYPGRASGAPIVDIFITLLAMGKSTLTKLKKQRKTCFELMKQRAKKMESKYKFKLLQSPGNSISLAMHITLQKVRDEQLTQLGSILYSKRVMGHRIVSQSTKKTKIGSFQFTNYGSHHQKYKYLPYITFASAVGSKPQQLNMFFDRLDESIKQLMKKLNKKNKKEQMSISKAQTLQKSMQQLKLQEQKQQKEQKLEQFKIEDKL